MTWSIIIPTCDRPDRLRRALALVLPQQPDEIIVTDDGSCPARDWLAAEFPIARWLAGPRRGPAANRNHAARAATGGWLVFLDDDCEPAPGWLAAYRAAAQEGAPAAIEGRTMCPREDRFAFREVVENLGGGAWWSCNFAIRRELFLQLGGFDEDFTEACAEDMEFAHRLLASGAPTSFAPGALVIHPPRPLSPRTLLARAARHRWHLLYRIKTGRDGGVLRIELLETARMAAQWVRGIGRPFWRERTILLLWRCVTLPLFLPYYLRWRRAFAAYARAR